MKKQTNSKGINDLSPRAFTFNELSIICDNNFGILNNCIDMSLFNSDDIFVLYPVMVHYHAQGEKVPPHLRTRVQMLDESETLAFQDVTFDQWVQGIKIQKSAC